MSEIKELSESIDILSTENRGEEDSLSFFSTENNQEESSNNSATMTSEVINKEEELQTSKYSTKSLSDEEKQQAEELSSSFSLFLKKNFSIDVADEPVKATIPTGIDLLDTILGGGVATGLVQFVGPPGSGKSAIAARILATGQKKYPGKFIGVYIDCEESMTTERLQQLGVNNPPIKPYTGGVTVEKVFQIVEGLCAFKEEHGLTDIPSVIVWDSLANTLTEKGHEGDDPNSVLGQKARLLSHLLPKYVPKLNKYCISLVVINQFREKIDMGIFKTPNDLRYLGDKVLPGGKSVLFNSIQLFFLRPVADVDNYGFRGVRVSMKGIKNKIFAPNIEIEVMFSFERGFTNFFTNYELLKKFKRIKAGAWCSLVSYPNKKFRQSEVINLYREDPEFRKHFDEAVRDVLKTEYIDKYATTPQDSVDLF